MEWLYQNLGTVGAWLASYKLVGTTIGLVTIILWLAVSVFKETREKESVILDHEGNPYQIRTVSKAQAAGIIGATITCIGLVIYGAYSFYRVTPTNLLEKYPLGYIIFDVDRQSGVFPYETKYLMKDWSVDWNGVHLTDTGNGNITLIVPRIENKIHDIVIGEMDVTIQKKAGFKAYLFSTPTFEVPIEILAVTKSGAVVLIGFAPRSKT